jgi:hypothetical protein
MRKSSAPSTDCKNAGEVTFDITFEKLSNGRIAFSVWVGEELRHKDVLNPSVASAREKFAKLVADKLKVPGSAVEALLLKAAAELERERVVGSGESDDARATIANISATGRGLPIEEIAEDLRTLTGGWPKRVRDRLFARTTDHRVLDLEGPSKLFAWIDRQGRVVWSKAIDCVTQERFYEHLGMTAESFEAIEMMPHTPPLRGLYYMHPDLPEAGGGCLDQLLSFFRPAGAVDRQLLKAALATPAWGGNPGSQPAFLFVGPDDDREQMGRGVGKSTLTDPISQIYGGFVDISPQADIDKIKTRLLSQGARQKRVARLDNVKTHRFSWGELENLITTPVISGHDMYRGEGQRLNTLTWLITLNGANLSKDLAQRVVIIKLARPRYRKDWYKNVSAFIETHRWAILRDIQSFLKGPAAQGYRAITRWSQWEDGVLARGKIPVRCRKTILERQRAVDADENERDLVTAEFRDQLQIRQHDPNGGPFFIPSKLAAEWLSKATRNHYETNRATVHLKTLGIAELIAPLKSNGVPGWEWRGPGADERRKRTVVKEFVSS